jgi:hypothetical protein
MPVAKNLRLGVVAEDAETQVSLLKRSQYK